MKTRLLPFLLSGFLASVGCGDAQLTQLDGPPPDEVGGAEKSVWCSPEMTRFPVNAEHNIGYDGASCGSGTCATGCPDGNANSDFGGVHHGIDVFAFHRAPIVAVASGTIRRVGWPSATSGLRVTLSDGCGWWYYYGHLDEAVVGEGQHVEAGQLIGYMGKSGAPSVHLHFNVSPDGDYYSDINPFDLLNATSGTACGGGVGGDGCSAAQRGGCGSYGCGCVDGQCNGGVCP
ncbi:MAG: M23 family metallopeptidase, partial [Myxococcales bacterium]|nr:M23 family metallopeptidase [Myxococcales bacterium]